MRRLRLSENRRFRLPNTRYAVVKILMLVIALIIPINVITLVLFSQVTKQDASLIAKEVQYTLDFASGSAGSDLDRVTRRMLLQTVDNSDFISFAADLNRYSQNRRSELYYQVSQRAEDIYSEYPIADLLWFDFEKNDYLITQGYTGVDREIYKEYIHSIREDAPGFGIVWRTASFGGKDYLVGSGVRNNIHYGVIVDLEKEKERLNLSDRDSRYYFFSDKEGNVLTSSGRDLMQRIGADWDTVRQSDRYDVLESAVGNTGLFLVSVSFHSSLLGSGSSAFIVWRVIVILISLAAAPIMIVCLVRWMVRPLRRIRKALNRIESGDMDYRMSEQSRGEEYNQITRSFNTMMDQVQSLKIEVYEKELEKRDIQMNFLSQQIQPHFILNALNILYNYSQEEYMLSRRMILCITRYFRYIVKGQNFLVELNQEMDHINNYLEIQRARYPGRFFTVVRYEPALKRALVPPLLIQNFVENAVKYAARQDTDRISILVMASVDEADANYMRISISDTGSGIPEEALSEIHHFQETGEAGPHLGVGIQNAIQRLKILYAGEPNEIHIGNNEGGGACIEIRLPLHINGEGEDDARFISGR